jgi:hypothetical protein
MLIKNLYQKVTYAVRHMKTKTSIAHPRLEKKIRAACIIGSSSVKIEIFRMLLFLSLSQSQYLSLTFFKSCQVLAHYQISHVF